MQLARVAADGADQRATQANRRKALRRRIQDEEYSAIASRWHLLWKSLALLDCLLRLVD